MKKTTNSLIPKKIHYFWFGNNPKPDIVLKCIESWKKHMPDYEIIEWNEQNYDINKIDYIKEAYKMKKWAFVSDYARFDILEQYGGIYFDTDVELLKQIPHEILSSNKAITSMESSGYVNPGLIFVSIPHHKFLNKILKIYEKEHFIIGDKINLKTINMYTTDLLKENGFVFEQKIQNICDIAIYPSSYFCGYDQDLREYDIKDETISVHHYAGTWKKKTFKSRMKMVTKKIFGKKIYKKILNIKRRIFGISR